MISEEKQQKILRKMLLGMWLNMKIMQTHYSTKLHKMNLIRSEYHQIYSMKINKSFSFFDDKRYILPNGIDFCAYGYKKIYAINKDGKLLSKSKYKI